MSKFKIFAICCLLSITSCGFHLRGVGGEVRSLPYQVWKIEQTQGLEEYLHDELKRHSVQIVHKNDAPAAEIRLLQFERGRDVGTLSRIGTVSEYLFTLRVAAQVSYQGVDVGEPIAVSLNRRQSYADNDLFGKQLEEEVLWQDMYQEAAKQIVRRLPYIQANQ
ncbi:MAG: hypothetical protein IKI11_09365 [Neisseriaceae bacterium]|nr:hypothetical protein [Neisseriaceae bacterium]